MSTRTTTMAGRSSTILGRSTSTLRRSGTKLGGPSRAGVPARSSSRANRATDAETASLDDLWEQARLEFQKNTGKDIGANRSKRMNDVMDDMAKKYDPSEDESPTKRRMKKVLSGVLQSLQLLAGVAADNLGDLNAPASFCFNAVSFLLDVPSKIRKFHEDLASLFEEIQFFLSQFRVMERIEDLFEGKRLPAELVETTNRLMCSFIKLCGLAYKPLVSGTFKKIMMNLKVGLLSDDSGVQEEMQKFKDLVKKHDSIKGAVTLENVLESKRGIEQIMNRMEETRSTELETNVTVRVIRNFVEEKSVKESTESQLVKLAEKLSVDPLFPQKQETHIQHLKADRVMNSGSWLKSDVEEYRKWLKPEPNTPRLLLLYGSEGTGKTMLVPTIIEDLESAHIGGTPVVIAHYSFEKGETGHSKEKEKKSGADKKPVSMALRSLALQLASKNKRYQLDLERDLKDVKDGSHLKSMSGKELWSKLRFTSGAGGADIVLILDGVEQLVKSNPEELLQLIEAFLSADTSTSQATPKPGSTKLRIVLTGDRQTFESYSKDPHKVAEIDVESENDEDVSMNFSDLQRFCRQEIENDDDLKSFASRHANVMEPFEDNLQNIASGRFDRIQRRLKRVSEAIVEDQDLDYIARIINETAEEDQDKLSRRLIDTLESTLSARDIEQLNEALKWVLYCKVWPGVEIMTSVTRLHTQTVTAQSFMQKLEDGGKFAKIFEIEEDDEGKYIQTRAEIPNDLITSTWQGSASGPGVSETKPKISMTVTIDHADPEAVQRFFWDLSELSTFDKSFFINARSDPAKGGTIKVDEFTSTATIILRCIDVIGYEYEDDLAELSKYAMEWLPQHMVDALKLERELDHEFPEKAKILQNLVSLLADPDYLYDHWVHTTGFHNNYFDIEAVDALDDWVTEEEAIFPVACSLDRKTAKLRKELLRKADGRGRVLYPFIKKVAESWLVEPRFEITETFPWVEKYVSLQNLRWVKANRASRNDKDNTDDEDEDGSENKSETSSDDDEDARSIWESDDSSDEESDSDVEDAVLSDDDDDDDGSENGSVQETKSTKRAKKISAASDWVKQELDVDPNNVWYMQLANTYLTYRVWDRAIKFFEKISDDEEAPWAAHIGIARARNGKKDVDGAVASMETAVMLLRANDNLDADGCDALEEAYGYLSKWWRKLKKPGLVIEVAEEIASNSPHEYTVYWNMLEISRKEKSYEYAKYVLQKLSADEGRTPSLTMLTEFFVELTGSTQRAHGEKGMTYKHVAALANRTRSFDVVQDSLRKALVYLNENNKDAVFTISCLTLMEADLIALQDRDREASRTAFEKWDWVRKTLEDTEWSNSKCYVEATWRCLQYHYSKADPDNLRSLAQKAMAHDGPLLFNTFPAYYGAQRGDTTVRDLWREHVNDAFYLLSDDDDENDYQGYMQMARAFLAVNEEQNALAAFSLVGPTLDDAEESNEDEGIKSPGTPDETVSIASSPAKPPSRQDTPSNIGNRPPFADSPIRRKPVGGTTPPAQPEKAAATAKDEGDREGKGIKPLKGPVNLTCNGHCGRSWTYMGDSWKCKVCPDVDLCNDCYRRLQRGDFDYCHCSKAHEFLYLPPWDVVEHRRVGKGKVRLSQQIGSGRWDRRTGEIVDIAVWLGRVKTDWALSADVPMGDDSGYGSDGSSGGESDGEPDDKSVHESDGDSS